MKKTRASKYEAKFRNELIYKDIEQGVPPKVIMNKYNITENCLRQIYWKGGYSCYMSNKSKPKPEERAKCVKDWLENEGQLTYEQIAERNNCSITLAYSAITAYKKQIGQYQIEQNNTKIKRKQRFLLIQKMLADGKTFRQIAEELKSSSHQAIFQFYKRELKKYEETNK
jgi:transposase